MAAATPSGVPLSASWRWYEHLVDTTKGQLTWEEKMRMLGSTATSDEFWSYFEHVPPPSELFQQGVCIGRQVESLSIFRGEVTHTHDKNQPPHITTTTHTLTRTRTHARTNTHTHHHTHTHIHARTHTHTHTHSHAHSHARTLTSTHARTHTRTHPTPHPQVLPKWEDPMNEQGGEWFARKPFPSAILDALWEVLVLGLVSDTFGKDSIMGARVCDKSARGRSLYRLEVWYGAKAEPEEVRTALLQTFASVTVNVKEGNSTHRRRLDKHEIPKFELRSHEVQKAVELQKDIGLLVPHWQKPAADAAKNASDSLWD